MKKILATILVVALAGGAWGATSVGTWSALRTAAISGGEIVLTGDITADDNWGSIELDDGQSVELDLAGHSISVPADWFESGLISIYEGSSLTIKGGGMIDASSREEDDGFTLIDNYGTLTIKSGVTLKANAEFYAYALSCGDEGTTVVEDGVVLEGEVYPDGFTFAADGKTVAGKHTVSGGSVVAESVPTDSVVAKIGDTEYTSLAAAISDVPANGTETTIVMQADTVLDATVVIPAGKKVILDLNGKAITVPNATPHIYAIRNNGTMTLTDSKGSGSISARGVYNGPDNTSAKMTVEGGTYYNLDSDGGAAIFNKAELTVNGGTFNGTAVCLNNSGSAATMIVNGATANGYTNYAVQNNGGTVTINDITVNGKFGAFGQWQGTSTTTINGGTFAIVDNTYAGYTHHCVYVGAGDLTINGGTFTNGDNQADSGLALCMLSSGTATITGGTFTNLAPDAGNETISLWGGSGTFAVSGGTYNRQVKAEYCAADYSPTTTADANGMYTVASEYVAQVISVDGATTNKYANLMEAINAAYNGGTVELLADVTVDHWHQNIWTLAEGSAEYPEGMLREPTAGPNGLTINGNGHSLTINGIDSAGNGNHIFAGSRNLTVSNITINAASGVNGIGLKSGTISDVTFNMAGSNPAIYTSGSAGCEEGEHIEIRNCTFNTSASDSYGIYSCDPENGVDSGTIISGNTFNTRRSVALRSDMQFLNNTVNGQKGVTVAGGSTAVVRGNYFADTTTSRSINVYPSNATIENNVILGPIELEDETYAVAPDLSNNYWGGDAPANLPEGVVVNSYYTTYSGYDSPAQDGSLFVLSDPVETYVAQVVTDDGATTNKYDTVDAALKAVETLAGATVNIFAGDYTLTTTKYKFADDVTIVGATDSEGNNLVTLNNSLTINDASLYTTGAKNLTLKNLNVSAPSGATALTRCGFEGNTVIEHCTLSGKNGVQNCYVKNGGNVAFKDCVATGTTYGIHFGGASGTISIDGCTITGWTSFDGSITKLDLANTRFEDGTYDYLRFYQDAVISNCSFNANMKVNEKSSGKSLIVIDSSVDGKAMASIITEGDDDLPVENNYVAVGTGVELDENGYITGGLFERVDDALIASECVTGSNSDGETSVTYPTAVGLLRVTDIEPQPGATEMKATYAVTAVVVNDEGEPIGIFASQQMIEVSIAAADVAGSTLAKYDVSKVLDAALASAGLNVTKVEISVVASAPSSGEGSVSYEVHPEAVVTVTEDATDTTTTIPLSNACLAADASFTFDLDVTGVVAAGDWAKVTHESADPNYSVEVRNVKAVAGDGGKVYVSVTTTHFSTFTVGAGVPPITFGVRSDNLFGSIKIEENVASNLYVALPFEGFEANGTLRKAQDVIHSKNLAPGTKMYVYDKAADKYDVYEVGTDGAWKGADKVTIDTNGKATFDTVDLTRGVTAGTGAILERKNTSETVYVYGQVPMSLAESVTFEAGQTLISPPYTNATVTVGGVKYVDMNAFTWTGVAPAQTKRLRTTGADYIQFRDKNNKQIRYFYLNDGGWGLQPTQAKMYPDYVADGKALVPVGTAFWYWSKSGGASVTW